jgi:hypothetical protein
MFVTILLNGRLIGVFHRKDEQLFTESTALINVRENTRGKSRMYNPETLATPCTKLMFGSSLPPIVCRRADILFMLFVFACI